LAQGLPKSVCLSVQLSVLIEAHNRSFLSRFTPLIPESLYLPLRYNLRS